MDTIAASLARFSASLGDSGPGCPPRPTYACSISAIPQQPGRDRFRGAPSAHFQVDLIVNTGDITDYGTGVKEAFIQRLRQPTGIQPGRWQPRFADHLRTLDQRGRGAC